MMSSVYAAAVVRTAVRPSSSNLRHRIQNYCQSSAMKAEDAATKSREEKRESRRERIRKLRESLTPAEREVIDRILRVDHAGELGADRIYAGQLAVLRNTDVGPLIQHMWDEEKRHLAKFEELIPKYRARPTALYPIWSVAGWAVGAGSALLGKEAAMACTVAVETVITEHYESQLRTLVEMRGTSDKHKELQEIIREFRDDEMQHHDIGIENDAEKTPFYQLYKTAIETGCRGAIWLAERV